MESVGKDYLAGIQMLASYSRDLMRAKARTAECFEVMADLAGRENVSGIWTHTQATADRFKTLVLDRFFEIVTRPISHDDEGKIACLVLVRDEVTNAPREFYRFQITRAGEAQSTKGEELISHRSEAGPEMLLVQISLAVLAG